MSHITSPDLPELPPLMQRALNASRNRRALTVLSTTDMRQLCHLAVLQHDIITTISMAATQAARLNCAIEPVSLHAAIMNGFAEITPPTEAPAESKTA